jgi:hypothetical protein
MLMANFEALLLSCYAREFVVAHAKERAKPPEMMMFQTAGFAEAEAASMTLFTSSLPFLLS